MDGKELVKLAAEFTAGGISAEAIKDHFGEGVLSSVLALAGGFAVGGLASEALDILDDNTGIVSDIGSVVDDFFSIF